MLIIIIITIDNNESKKNRMDRFAILWECDLLYSLNGDGLNTLITQLATDILFSALTSTLSCYVLP